MWSSLKRRNQDWSIVVFSDLSLTTILFAFHADGFESAPFPQEPGLIKVDHDGCDLLKVLIVADDKDQFTVKWVKGYHLLHYRNKIFMTETLMNRIVDWYHELLVHPGTSHLEVTLQQHYLWALLHEIVQSCCKYCYTCQLLKKQNKKCEKMPAKKVQEKIWNQVKVGTSYYLEQKW